MAEAHPHLSRGAALRIAVVAPHMGNPRSATTTRYNALRTAAASRGHGTLFLAAESGSAVGSDIRQIGGPPPDNRSSLLRRAVREIKFGMAAGLRSELKHVDVVLVGVPEVIAAMVTGALLRARGIRYVLDVRDAYPAVYVEAGILKEGSAVLGVIKRRLHKLYRRASSALAATEGIRESVHEAGVPATRTQTVRNGYTAGIFEPQAAPSAPTDGRLRVGIHGTLGRFQNVEALARLIDECRRQQLGWTFVVIGDGPAADRLTPVASGTDVEWIRAATQQEIAARISQCHVALSLRTADWIGQSSLPVRVFEYIGLAVPMVLFPPSEAGEIVASEGFGTVVSDAAPESLIRAIVSIAEPHRRESARAAMLRERERFRADSQWVGWLESLEAQRATDPALPKSPQTATPS